MPTNMILNLSLNTMIQVVTILGAAYVVIGRIARLETKVDLMWAEFSKGKE